MHAGDFARHWQDAWNRRDIEDVLRLFHDDVLFTSPLMVKIDPDGSGILKGKDALRRYWRAAIAKLPDLRFEVTSLFEGVDCLLIGFRNEAGVDRFEVLRFRDGLVIEGHGTYPAAMAV